MCSLVDTLCTMCRPISLDIIAVVLQYGSDAKLPTKVAFEWALLSAAILGQ